MADRADPKFLNTGLDAGLLGAAGYSAELAQRMEQQFTANLSWLKNRFPDLYTLFSAFTPKQAAFSITPGYLPNVSLSEGCMLYGNDPLKDCTHQVQGILKTLEFRFKHIPKPNNQFGMIQLRYLRQTMDENPDLCGTMPEPGLIKASPVIYAYGLGLGYHLPLLEQALSPQFIVVIEPEPELFFAALHTCDLAGLDARLAAHGGAIWLETAQSPDIVLRGLRRFYRQYGAYLTAVRTQYMHYHSQAIDAISAYIARYEFSVGGSAGIFDDGLFAMSHAAENARLGRHFALKTASLEPDMRTVPVFIIGNGPSLDADIPYLRRHQDECLIVACGTALDALYHAGIQPDFYCCIERTSNISRTLNIIPDSAFLSSITLIAPELVHPDVPTFFDRCLLFFKADDVTLPLALLHDSTSRNMHFLVDCSPLVSNLALSAFLELGFENLYLFGIDNGTPIDRQTQMHSSASELYNQHTNATDQESYNLNFNLPGNFSGPVRSGFMYALSIEAMEDLIRVTGAGRHIHNCSDGARIAGTVPVHSQDITLPESRFCKKDIIEHLHTNMSAPYPELGDVRQWFAEENFPAAADESLTIAQRLQEACSRHEAIATLSEFNAQMQTLADSFRHCTCRMLSGMLHSFSLLTLRALYQYADEKRALRACAAVSRLCLYCLSDAKKLSGLIPDYVMGRHGTLTDGKIGFDHEGSTAPRCPTATETFISDTYRDPLPKFIKRTT